MGNLKYYDGFGKDVTDYVQELEQKAKLLETVLDAAKVNSATDLDATWVAPMEIVPAEDLANELDDLNTKVMTTDWNKVEKEESIGKVDLTKTKRKRKTKIENASPK